MKKSIEQVHRRQEIAAACPDGGCGGRSLCRELGGVSSLGSVCPRAVNNKEEELVYCIGQGYSH